MLEFLKFVTDPKERFRRAFYYLCRIEHDVEWVPGWERELWDLIQASPQPVTNICQCDLRDMKLLAERSGYWVNKDRKIITLAEWEAILKG